MVRTCLQSINAMIAKKGLPESIVFDETQEKRLNIIASQCENILNSVDCSFSQAITAYESKVAALDSVEEFKSRKT